MGYIEQLRELVGHRPLILTGAGVIVLNDRDEVLLQKNPEGKWSIPGGFMELGESAEEAGRREVFEETGIQIGKLDLVTVISGKGTFTKLQNKDEYYSVTIVYMTKDIIGGELKPDGTETVDARFFSVRKLPAGLNPHIAAKIKGYFHSDWSAPY